MLGITGQGMDLECQQNSSTSQEYQKNMTVKTSNVTFTMS